MYRRAVERQVGNKFATTLEEGEVTDPDPAKVDLKPLRHVFDHATGNTLLMLAVIDNRLNLLERLLDLGCEINARNYVSRRFPI